MSAVAKPSRGLDSFRIKVAAEALYLTLDNDNKVVAQPIQESNTRQKWYIAFEQGSNAKEDSFTAVSWNEKQGLALRDGALVGGPIPAIWIVDERNGAPNYSLIALSGSTDGNVLEARDVGQPALLSAEGFPRPRPRQRFVFERLQTPPPQPPVPNVHIVIFRYRSNVDEAARSALAKAFVALQTQCVSVSTGKPYIASLKAGKNYSKEGFDKWFEHAFVMEFTTEADRQYYLNTDPAHNAFKKLVGPVVEREDTFVFDFVPGVF